MQRIAIDMDGVLADVATQFRLYAERETGLYIPAQSIEGKAEIEAFPHFRAWLDTPGFFRHVGVMPDSQAVVAALTRQYEVFIVSAATEFPNSLLDKQSWLHDHFPFISWRHIVFCGSKTIIQADIMIDDHFKNLDFFNGKTLLFTAHHNALSDAKHHTRVAHWLEIADILLTR